MHHAFLNISFLFLHDHNVKMPNFAFYGGRKQATTKFFFLFPSFDMVPWNSASGGFAYFWQSKWVGIIAIKTEGTQIHLLSDVLVAVASLDLKVPNESLILILNWLTWSTCLRCSTTDKRGTWITVLNACTIPMGSSTSRQLVVPITINLRPYKVKRKR